MKKNRKPRTISEMTGTRRAMPMPTKKIEDKRKKNDRKKVKQKIRQGKYEQGCCIMLVYSVVGYFTYYPSVNNNIKCFKNLEDAENFLEEISNSDDCTMDFYEIIPIEVY